jgi:phosphoglycolate phosphatase
MVERALADTGVEAANTYVIGDTTFDMQMAYNAGVAAIGVGWGYHAPKALIASGARQVLGHPIEFVDIIAKKEEVRR